MPIPVQLYNSLVPVQLCRTTTTTRVLYRSTTTVPVQILLARKALFCTAVQSYSNSESEKKPKGDENHGIRLLEYFF